MDSVARAKRELRLAMRARALPAPGSVARVEAGLAAAGSVASLPAFERAETIALFASIGREIATRPLFERARAADKRTLFPRIVRDAHGPSAHIELAPIDAWDELVIGELGVPSPLPGARTYTLDEVGLVVVPGLAFDAAGGRLGRGGGFYDRLLGRDPVPFTCGLAYAAQLVDEVPMAAWDVRVRAVATERGCVIAAGAQAIGDRCGEESGRA